MTIKLENQVEQIGLLIRKAFDKRLQRLGLMETSNRYVQGTTVNMMPSNKLLTVKEVAELLRCSRQHVYNLIACGRIRSGKVGNRHRIEENEVMKYLYRKDQ